MSITKDFKDFTTEHEGPWPHRQGRKNLASGSEAVGTVASAHLKGSLEMLLPVCETWPVALVSEFYYPG